MTSLELGDSEDSKAPVHRTARTPCSYTLFTGRHVFLPTRRYASTGTSHDPVSVCLSVTSQSSIETAERIWLFFVWELPSTHPAPR